MKRFGTSLGILTAVVLASTPVLAHEDCDDVDHKTAMAERSDGVGPQSPGAANVTIKLFQYQPGRIQVKAGTTVTWKNEDDIPHTVASTTRAFKSKALDTDDSYTFTFTTPGVYEYFCSIHPHMTGKIVVEAKTGSN